MGRCAVGEPSTRERPIIFGAESVRAIIDGRKTQTRRVVAPANSLLDGGPWPRARRPRDAQWDAAYVDAGPSPAGNPGPYLRLPWGGEYDGAVSRIYSRAWIGDRLWVREAHWFRDAEPLMAIGKLLRFHPDSHGHWACPNGVEVREELTSEEMRAAGWRPRSPIHMPRWASRITLEITSVRVERVQAISDEDVAAEIDLPVSPSGTMLVELTGKHAAWEYLPSPKFTESEWRRACFASGWDRLNAARGFSWASDPFVWVYEFRRVG